MESYDQYDALNAALNAYDDYPVNLLRSQSFEHELAAYSEALQQQESRLFGDDHETSGIKLLESYDGWSEFMLKLWSSLLFNTGTQSCVI